MGGYGRFRPEDIRHVEELLRLRSATQTAQRTLMDRNEEVHLYYLYRASFVSALIAVLILSLDRLVLLELPYQLVPI